MPVFDIYEPDVRTNFMTENSPATERENEFEREDKEVEKTGKSTFLHKIESSISLNKRIARTQRVARKECRTRALHVTVVSYKSN